MIVQCVPQIPDRSGAILARGDSWFPHLLDRVVRLEAGGAELTAVPCNTAHHWYSALVSSARIPAACDALEAQGSRPGVEIAILATAGTLASGFYRARLVARGFELAAPLGDENQRLVPRGIAQTNAEGPRRRNSIVRACVR